MLRKTFARSRNFTVAPTCIAITQGACLPPSPVTRVHRRVSIQTRIFDDDILTP
jgi:hypothetical protein